MNRNIVLITGSTSGIGGAFAELFAEKGNSLVLVARNREKLNLQSRQLTEKYGVNTYVIAYDLTQRDAAEVVYQEIKRLGLQIQILINNAGFNECGSFLVTSGEKETEMMQLHMIFTTQLMKCLLPQMVEKGYGRILNVGSTGSFMACPNNAVYAATKAYILSVSKAIAAELKGTGVSVTTLCPGATRTQFASKAGIEDTLLFQCFVMNSDKVARIGYRALRQQKVCVIAGGYNKLLVLFSLILPDGIVNWLCKRMYNKF